MVNKPKYLLDTCVCISMFRNEGRVREMLSSVGTKNCLTYSLELQLYIMA